MIDFTGFLSSLGFITMASGDGGDSLQKTTLVGVMQIVAKDNNGPLKDHGKAAIQAAEVEPGIYVRMPGTDKWYSRITATSRDQIVSLIMWSGFVGDDKRILRQLKQQVKRLGRYQNTHEEDGTKKFPDIMGPEELMQYARALYMCGGWYKLLAIPGYTLGQLFDLQTLLGSIYRVVSSYLNPNSSDHDNFILGMLQHDHSFHTIPSLIAKWIYLTYCPPLGYTDDSETVKLRDAHPSTNGPLSALMWKHRKSTGAPPIGEYAYSQKVL